MRSVLLFALLLAASPAFADRLFPLTTSSSAVQALPALVSGGSSTLALWVEVSDQERPIYASVVSANGSILADRVLLSSRGSNSEIAGAFNGYEYLIVWQRAFAAGNAIMARRISAGGNPVDSDEIILDAGAVGSPSVASDGSGWVVTWSRGVAADPYGPCGVNVVAARVSASGRVPDANAVVLLPAGRNQLGPGVVWDGSSYVFAWQNSCHPFKAIAPIMSITVVRTSAELKKLDSLDVTGPNKATCCYKDPHLALFGRRVLLAWGDGDGPYQQSWYWILEGNLPHLFARRRAVGVSPPAPQPIMIDGYFIDSRADASGNYVIVQRRGTLAEWVVTPFSAAEGRVLTLDTARGEQMAGRVISVNNRLWMPVLASDSASGQTRLYIHEFD